MYTPHDGLNLADYNNRKLVGWPEDREKSDPILIFTFRENEAILLKGCMPSPYE